ncbi:hypothetical protein B0J18DRAFT_468258 [Chaetomium sp. MPI-SDFR-AT-0129]|nr:hypothetical protein B0J18DRAFT_468258 [Chaetomium sp. MPI-SDFR-AT-0129]
MKTAESRNVDASNWDMPPPSQSHFSQFANFAPDDGASFEDEFKRLASSQNWEEEEEEEEEDDDDDNEEDEEDEEEESEENPSDSQDPSAPPPSSQPRPRIRSKTETKTKSPTKTKTKTKPQPQPPILTDQQRILQGYQSLCVEVGLPPPDTIKECKHDLKNTLVNIIDLIDVRRVVGPGHRKVPGKKKKKQKQRVKVWDDFEAFRRYTLQPEHRIDREEAKRGDGILASLLQRLYVPDRKGRGKRRGREPGKDGASVSKTVSGRVTKGGKRRI